MSTATNNGTNADVESAIAILRDAGFPVERVRILPAAPVSGARQEDEGPDRDALLKACLEALKDGKPRSARELSDRVQSGFEDEVTKRHINSVLSREGRDLVTYDRETYTYQLKQ